MYPSSRITIKYLMILAGIFTLALNARSQEDHILIISGLITNETSHEPLEGITVTVKETSHSTSSGKDGRFTIREKHSLPLTLVFSSVQFEKREVFLEKAGSSLHISLTTRTVLADEVVVTASRVPESILRSPVAVEKIDVRSIRETASPGFYEALANVKGVQLTTSSLTFKVPNTRGFNIPNNFRFVQLVDGVDMQAATLGVPLGNAIGPTELDIQSVEITPGAASALYGMSAINGMSNLITRSPFITQGLSIYHKTGVNHADGRDHAPALLTETALRFAQSFHDKFAFKINMGYLQGTDWRSNTRLDQNPNNLKSANPQFPALDGAANTAFDGWNKYGDDALAGSNLVSISGLSIDGRTNQTLRVSRTGYWETDLVTPHVQNLKLDASLHYRFRADQELSYTFRGGKMDGVFQRGNKIRLEGVSVQNHAINFKGRNFMLMGYASFENTGHSFNVKPLADNMDLYTGGNNNAWAAKYKTALNEYAAQHEGTLTSQNLAAATAYARQKADASRAEPGTERFANLKDSIISINNWDIRSLTIPNAPITGGAALIQKSRLYHAEGQWDLSERIHIFNLLLGADARIYDIIPDGNNFVDFSRPIAERNIAMDDGRFGKDLYYKKFGAFTQVSKTLVQEKLKLFGSLRFDYNPDFEPRFTPRVAVVYTAAERHHFRLTWQMGYRYPAVFEALSYVNNGRVKRVGSLPFINQGLGYLENSYTQASVIRFNAAVSAAGNADEAALANRNLLVVADLPKATPEKISSLEAGYKSILLDNCLVVDFDTYLNKYNGFLGQVQVFVPHEEKTGSDAAVLAMLDRNRDATPATSQSAASKGQDRYRVYTNAKNAYTNYGAALSLTGNLPRQFLIKGNISFNKLISNAQDDIFVTGFNTPLWTSNLSFGNRKILPDAGFNITWHWQDAFLWESPLVTGKLPAFNTLDAQVNYRIKRAGTTLKLGGANLLNNRHLEYAGGPAIGALYYLAVTIENLL